MDKEMEIQLKQFANWAIFVLQHSESRNHLLTIMIYFLPKYTFTNYSPIIWKCLLKIELHHIAENKLCMYSKSH